MFSLLCLSLKVKQLKKFRSYSVLFHIRRFKINTDFTDKKIYRFS